MFGGFGGGDTNTIAQFDPTTRQWSQLGRLSHARHSANAFQGNSESQTSIMFHFTDVHGNFLVIGGTSGHTERCLFEDDVNVVCSAQEIVA